MRPPGGEKDLHKVFVRGTTGLRDEDLSTTFSPFGEIISIRSHSGGYSFVTYRSTQSAADALEVTRVKDHTVECHLAFLEHPPPARFRHANLPPRPGFWDDHGGRSERRSEGGRNRGEWDDYGNRRGGSRSRSRERERRRSRSRSRDRHRRGRYGDDERRERRRHRSRSRSRSRDRRSRREGTSRDRLERDRSPRARNQRSRSPHRRRRSRSRSPRRRRSQSPSRRRSTTAHSERHSSSRGHLSSLDGRRPLTPQSELGARSEDRWREGVGKSSPHKSDDGKLDNGDLHMEGKRDPLPARARFADEKCCLAVRNLSKICTAESLRALASECGQVSSVVVHHYYVGEGMLEYETTAETEEALRTLNGRQLHGLTLRLQRP